MFNESFFFDQSSRRFTSSQFGRRRRDLDEYHRALYSVQVLLSFEDKKTSGRILRQLKQPILPEILTADLDRLLPYVSHGVSWPSSILVQFHSTWTDLIEQTNYRFPVWQTKIGEEQYLKEKDLPPVKTDDFVAPLLPLKRRLMSRVSILSLSHSTAETSRLHLKEPLIKNGVRLEFQFSQPSSSDQQIARFDLSPRTKVNVDHREILLRCQQLLTAAKAKISKMDKPVRVWFYEENHFSRRKQQQSGLKQKSKFAQTILRHSIPEKYSPPFDNEASEKKKKKKSFLELPDGSTQIYYPSGRLAILRVRPPLSTVVFFDDTESTGDRFLGSITCQGHLVIQSEKSSRRRLFTNEEKGETQTALLIQLNSSIEVQYRDPTDIRLKFTSEKEEYRLQVGVKSSLPSTTTTTKHEPSSNPLAELKCKAQQICHDWLEHCRTMLGIRSLDEYYLPDLIVDPSVASTRRRFLPLINSRRRRLVR